MTRILFGGFFPLVGCSVVMMAMVMMMMMMTMMKYERWTMMLVRTRMDGTTINVSSSSASLEWFKTSAEQDFDVHFFGYLKNIQN